MFEERKEWKPQFYQYDGMRQPEQTVLDVKKAEYRERRRRENEYNRIARETTLAFLSDIKKSGEISEITNRDVNDLVVYLLRRGRNGNV